MRERITVSLNQEDMMGKLISRYLNLYCNHHPQVSKSKALQIAVIKYLSHYSPTYHTPVSYVEYDILIHSYHVLKSQLNHFQLVSDRNSYNLALLAHQGKSQDINSGIIAYNQEVENKNLAKLTKQLNKLNEILLKKKSKN